MRAVMERDARADGTFVYAVRTTGIYCRPSCPSRRPAATNIVFFETGADAAEAGFRACRRCHPDRVHRHEQVVARVQALLDASDEQVTLADLSAAVGMSPFHLQRVFKSRTGLTPKAYAQATRAARVEERLGAGAGVATALYDAGYGSSRALYEAADRELGMTPGRRRAGGPSVTVRYGFADTRLGRMLLAATERGVAAVHFGEGDDELLALLEHDLPRATLVADQAAVRPHVEAVEGYLGGAGRSLDLPLDVVATAFQERVWRALGDIPAGQTRTYGEVAAAIGQPRAARAVARACAANPVALVIPCHRVVRTGGAMAGYRWGAVRKRRLLAAEAPGEGETERPPDD
jgi:AraC family transcriptional regulator, regulatory protein of adaptative response / methylated-DNA-[protein]-cysteine methyltransferase